MFTPAQTRDRILEAALTLFSDKGYDKTTMRELAQELEPDGVRVVDAPISGGALKARDGTLAIIMGGRAEDCEELHPLMQSMGSSIFHCGPLGAGQATKIVNNLVGITTLMIAAEAYRIAGENGIALPDAIPVFEASTGRNFFTVRPNDAGEAYDAWTATRADFDSLQAILRKDIDLGLAAGRTFGVPMPVTSITRDMVQTLIGHGHADQDFSALLLLQAQASGIELKPENVQVGDGLS